ncbi:MAG: superinfection immunity protein [Oceanicaulis sp.]
MAAIVLGGLFVGYFLPAFIAALRAHPDHLAIFFLNLFLGWTLIGWVVSLVWAVTGIAHRKAAKSKR